MEEREYITIEELSAKDDILLEDMDIDEIIKNVFERNRELFKKLAEV